MIWVNIKRRVAASEVNEILDFAERENAVVEIKCPRRYHGPEIASLRNNARDERSQNWIRRFGFHDDKFEVAALFRLKWGS